MRKLLLSILVLFSLSVPAQFRPSGQFQNVQVPYNSSGSTTDMYVSLPTQYAANPGKVWPLWVFLHGAGEAGTSISTIYNSQGSGGVLYYIEHNGFPDSILNTVDGKYYSFIVVGPQRNNQWSTSGDELDVILRWLVTNYHVDPSRLYGSGPSAGGAGIMEYIGHLDPAEDAPTGGNDHVRTYKLAAAAPMSMATNAPQLSWAQKVVGDTVAVWGFGDQNNDIYGENTWTMTKSGGLLNSVKAGSSYFTGNPGDNGTVLFSTGHGPWNPFYVSTFHSQSIIVPFNGSIPQFFLQFQRNIAITPGNPTAGAGSDQGVILPLDSVNLIGTATPGNTHTLVSTVWSQISGPGTALLRTPTALNTIATNLIVGLYQFQLAVTNNIGAIAKDTVQVNVSTTNYSPPIITVGGNGTITGSTQAITSSTVYTGAIQSSFLWSPLLKPGQTKYKFGILGSSTSAGNGASTFDSSYIGRFTTWAKANGIADSVIDFAVSGYNPYQAMPNGFVPNATVNAQLSPTDTPRTATNITALLNRGCNFVIVNFPTNAFDVLSFSNIKIPFQKFADTLTSLGIPYYFTGTQPRSDSQGGSYNLQTTQNKLKSLNDSLKAWFPGHIIDFYTNTTIPGTTQKIPAYDYGDSIHFNNLGHYEIFQNLIGTALMATHAAGGYTIVAPGTNNTSITGLGTGMNRVQATAVDTHGQAVTGVVTIQVNSGAAVANAGTDITLTLPTNSTGLTGAASTGATTYLWSQLTGPNTAGLTGATTVTPTISGLIQGIYTFQLQINNNISLTDQVQITVNPAVIHPCGSNAKYQLIRDPVDSSTYIPNDDGSFGYLPGDTIVLPSASSNIDLLGIHGSPGCPLTITNPSNSTAFIQGRFTCENCTNVHFTGTGAPGIFYGIVGQHDPQLRYQWYRSISIQGKSSIVEIDHYRAHNVDMGIVAEEDEGCDPTSNYPNWIMDSIIIHDNAIVGTWNEGMYIGNTSPDNADYDLRPVTCNGVTSYPAPAKNSYVHIYNNYVDSTGRGGIQVSNSINGTSDISFNTVKHSGLNGDDAQGTNIIIGLYTQAIIHDNTMSCPYTWNFASIGGCGDLPIRVENNTMDSAGYLNTYNLAVTNRIVYDPRTEPTVPSQVLSWPENIEIDTRTRLYTNTTPNPGTAVPGHDSTTFWLKSNHIGISRNVLHISAENNFGGFTVNGSIICNNVLLNGSALPTNSIFVAAGINYALGCGTSGQSNGTFILHKPGGKLIFKP